MGKEIERKFLVKDESYRSLAKPLFCTQGYLGFQIEPLVRVRIMGNSAFITLKGKSIGITRLEFEYEIPTDDAHALLASFCSNPKIEKKRFIFTIENTCWEVDEFLGDNKGLIVAEVELKSENEAFSKPRWLGKEVSEDPKYYNCNLVSTPYSEWTKEMKDGDDG